MAIIFGYLEVIVPFVKGEVKLSKRFPFVVSSLTAESRGTSQRKESDAAEMATLMFTDMVEYGTYKLRDESLAALVLEEYKLHLQTMFDKFNGRVVWIHGDDVLVEFTTALEAALCAIEIQQSLDERNKTVTEEKKYRARIGLHTGRVIHRGDDVVGEAVDIVSHFEPLTEPGGIWMTEPVHRKISTKLEIPVTGVTKTEMKGVKIPEKIYRIVESPEMRDLPSLEGVSASLRRTRNRVITSAGTVLVLVALVFSGYFLFTREAESGEPIPIAVVDFVNDTGEPVLDGLSGMLITSLEQSRHLSVITRSRMFDILKQLDREDVDRIDETLGREICRQAKIEFLVIASIRRFGELYDIDLKVLDPVKNEYLFTAQAEGRGQESIPVMIDNLSEETRRGLKEKADEIRSANQKLAEMMTTDLEAYKHFFEGEKLINSLKFEEAVVEFEKAVAKDWNFGLAWYRLAYAVGWWNEKHAKYPLDKALELIDRRPEKERYRVRAEKARYENGFEAGIKVLMEMQKLYPDSKEMLYNIGDWSFHEEKYDTAIVYLEKVIAIDPTFERALQHLVWTYGRLRDNEKMLEYARRYAQVSGSAEAYGMMGTAYANTGNLEEGMLNVKHALKMDPENEIIINSLADMYLLQGQYDSAGVEIARLMEDDRSQRAKEMGYWNSLDLAAYTGTYRKALGLMDEMQDMYLEDNDTTRVAILYLLKGHFIQAGWRDTEKVKEEIEKSYPLQDNIKGPDYWRNLAILASTIGEQPQMEKRPDDQSDSFTETWITYRDFFRDIQQHQCSSADSLIDFIRKDPTDLKFLGFFSLAGCHMEQGDYPRAAELLEELQVTHGFDLGRALLYPISYFLLGLAYEGIEDVSHATESYERFLTLFRNGDSDLVTVLGARERLSVLQGEPPAL